MEYQHWVNWNKGKDELRDINDSIFRANEYSAESEGGSGGKCPDMIFCSFVITISNETCKVAFVQNPVAIDANKSG